MERKRRSVRRVHPTPLSLHGGSCPPGAHPSSASAAIAASRSSHCAAIASSSSRPRSAPPARTACRTSRPCRRPRVSPAASRTARCCTTACRVTGSSRASAVALADPRPASRVSSDRRVGSARAANTGPGSARVVRRVTQSPRRHRLQHLTPPVDVALAVPLLLLRRPVELGEPALDDRQPRAVALGRERELDQRLLPGIRLGPRLDRPAEAEHRRLLDPLDPRVARAVLRPHHHERPARPQVDLGLVGAEPASDVLGTGEHLPDPLRRGGHSVSRTMLSSPRPLLRSIDLQAEAFRSGRASQDLLRTGQSQLVGHHPHPGVVAQLLQALGQRQPPVRVLVDGARQVGLARLADRRRTARPAPAATGCGPAARAWRRPAGPRPGRRR